MKFKFIFFCILMSGVCFAGNSAGGQEDYQHLTETLKQKSDQTIMKRIGSGLIKTLYETFDYLDTRKKYFEHHGRRSIKDIQHKKEMNREREHRRGIETRDK